MGGSMIGPATTNINRSVDLVVELGRLSEFLPDLRDCIVEWAVFSSDHSPPCRVPPTANRTAGVETVTFDKRLAPVDSPLVGSTLE